MRETHDSSGRVKRMVDGTPRHLKPTPSAPGGKLCLLAARGPIVEG